MNVEIVVGEKHELSHITAIFYYKNYNVLTDIIIPGESNILKRTYQLDVDNSYFGDTIFIKYIFVNRFDKSSVERNEFAIVKL